MAVMTVAAAKSWGRRVVTSIAPRDEESLVDLGSVMGGS